MIAGGDLANRTPLRALQHLNLHFINAEYLGILNILE